MKQYLIVLNGRNTEVGNYLVGKYFGDDVFHTYVFLNFFSSPIHFTSMFCEFWLWNCTKNPRKYSCFFFCILFLILLKFPLVIAGNKEIKKGKKERKSWWEKCVAVNNVVFKNLIEKQVFPKLCWGKSCIINACDAST